MANEFKIKKGLIVTGATGGTALDVQGSQGQLFSVTDDLSGSIFAVSDISGVPILDVNSDGTIQFSDLSAGTLVTDANGNISVSSGGGAGGPYLPLSAGSGERVTGDLYISDKLYMRPSATYGNGYKVMHVTGTGNAPYPTIINFSNYAKPSVMVINDENVGIGTTSPDSKLDVRGPSAVPADGNQTLSITNTTGGTQLNLGTTENAYGWIEAREGNTSRKLLLNPNGGSVGIGLLNPAKTLDVFGTGRFYQELQLESDLSGYNKQTGIASSPQPRIKRTVLESSIETNNAVVHPYFNNDLGNFVARGGTVTFGGLTATPSGAAQNQMFQPSNQFMGISSANISGNTWSITLLSSGDAAFNLNYGCYIGITFGSGSFDPTSMLIEGTTDATGAGGWSTALNSSAASTTYSTYLSSGGIGIKALRFTMGYTSGSPRVVSIFAYNYASKGMKNFFLGKDGGKVYGDIQTNSFGSNVAVNKISNSGNSFFNGGKVGISETNPVETLTLPSSKGAMLGFKRYYSNTGQVPAGVGTSYALTANLNDEQGTTLTSQFQYKFYLTTTGTGTYNSSVYIVYRNSADNAWDIHRVSSTGLSSNHPELTLSGNNALIYNDHPAAYNVSYRVETSYTGQSKTSPQIFGSDYMWTRDNTDLYYMDGDVGIGVSSPSFKLDVAGAIQTTGSLRITTANPGVIFKETDITDKNWDIQVNNGNLKFYEVNDARTVFDERVTFEAGGYVGIGETNPQAKLDIYDTSTKTAANPNTVEVFHTGSVVSNNLYPVAGLFTQRVSGSSNVFATGLVGVADKLGNYGYIATGVRGIGKLSGNISVNNADMQYMGVEGRIEMEGSNSVNLDDRAYSFYGTAEIDSGSHLKEYHGLYLNTPANSGTILNKFGVSQVDANSKNYFAGDVGIGTDNPRDILEIEGNMRFVNGEDHLLIKPNNAIQGADFIVGDGVDPADTPVMSLDGLSGGKVTIETSVGSSINADKTTLDIQGSQGQLFSVTDDLSGDIFSVADISGVPIMNVNSSGLVTVDGTSYFNGNVGINTSNPTVKLEITGQGAYDNVPQVIIASGGADSNSIIHFTDDDGGQVSAIGTAEGNILTLASHNDLVFRTDTSSITDSTNNRMIITSDGKVGIGTISPAYILEVNGVTASDRFYVPTASATTAWALQARNSANTADSGLYFDNGSGEILLRRSDNSLQGRLRAGNKSYLNGGYFGLGVTNPLQKLHINSGRMLISNNTTPFYIKVNSSYKSWVHHISSDDGYIFAPSTADGGETWDWSKQTKIQVDGTVKSGNFILSSDERIKTKIKDLSCNNINVNWKSFEIKGNEGEYRAGVIAQDLEKSHPEFVNTDDKGFKSVKYIDLLIAKIAELEARLEKAGI